MGQHISAYLAYGVPLPEHLDEGHLEDALAGNRWPEVSYLMAGPYDRDKPYLVTSCFFGDLGTFKEIKEIRTGGEPLAWDRVLKSAMEANGWPVLQPSWMLIADVS
jgi:hypothetical protein